MKPRAATPKPRLNAAWHKGHPMPDHPSMAERLAWHQEHEQHCACRPMPASLRALIR